MHLPATSAAQTFLMVPARKYVQFNQFAYPALQVFSVVERATQRAIIQSTGSAQPTWSQAELGGQFFYRNFPGYPDTTNAAGAAVLPDLPGLGFSGAQYLECDTIASYYAGSEVPLTVVCEAQCLNAGGTLWGFGDASDGYYLSLSFSSGGGGTFTLKEVNSSGTFTASATGYGNNAHVVTAVRAGGSLFLRVDGAQVATAAITGSTENFSTFVVGALNSDGSVSSYFNGSLGTVAVYNGQADILSVETFMLQELGVILGPSVGINSGF